MNGLFILAQAEQQAIQDAIDQPAASPEATTVQPGGPAPAQPGTEEPPFWAGPFVPLIIGLIVLYFFVFRSKTKQEKQRKDMLGNLKRGDRVQTIGGILGSVVEVRENEVVLKVDESTNTKIRFSRTAIHRVLEDEKAEK